MTRAKKMPVVRKSTWQYKCATCDRLFFIWWVSAEEWKAGGFEEKHVCKQCFETRVPNPRYYSLDEYLDDTDIFEIVREHCPNLSLNDAKRFDLDLRLKLRGELARIWGK